MTEAIKWGTKENWHWRPNANPTADNIIVNEGRILLIKRSSTAEAEPDKWALPGGFVNTDSPKGIAWAKGLETPREAAARELKEETGIEITEEIQKRMVSCGIYEKGGRDPRDNNISWAQSHVFGLKLTKKETKNQTPLGADDASLAEWIPLSKLTSMLPNLAFDHAKIIDECIEKIPNLNPEELKEIEKFKKKVSEKKHLLDAKEIFSDTNEAPKQVSREFMKAVCLFYGEYSHKSPTSILENYKTFKVKIKKMEDKIQNSVFNNA